MAIHILVVEDEPDMQLLIEKRFRHNIRAGEWHFSFVANGKEALDFLQHHRDIYIILSDIRMPEMDGLTLLNHLAEQYPTIFTIIISAYGDMKNIRTAMNRGAFDFLMKPIDFADLDLTLKKTIHKLHQNLDTTVSHRLSKDQLLCLQQAVEALPIGITMVDLDGHISYTNPAEARLHGYEVHELIGQDVGILAPPEFRRKFRPEEVKNWQGLIRESINIRRDGTIFPVWLCSEIVRDEHDEPQGIVTSCKPLEDFPGDQRTYSTLINYTSYGIAVFQQQQIQFANSEFLRLFQLNSYISTTVDDLLPSLHPDDRDAIQAALKHPQQNHISPSRHEFRLIYPAGEIHWLETVLQRVIHQNQLAVQAIFMDMTSQKMKEMQLLQEKEEVIGENLRLRSLIQSRRRLGEIVGQSLAMQQVYEIILKAARSDAPVMLSGESGTGKELVARTIHHLSARQDKNFMAVNCGAIPENLMEREFFGHKKGAFSGATHDQPGFFDAADHGTLFLDEVSELPLAMQVKLLRVIDGNGYTPVGDQVVKYPDVRIIAVTNQPVEILLRGGTMRQDFFYRLHVIPIILPPLRDRREDVPLLIEHFLTHYGASRQILPQDIWEQLVIYPWPGNIRQLRNVIHRYLTLHTLSFDRVQERSIALAQTTSLETTVTLAEKEQIQHTLQQHHGNRTYAAKALGISLRTLQRRLKKYGLE